MSRGTIWLLSKQRPTLRCQRWVAESYAGGTGRNVPPLPAKEVAVVGPGRSLGCNPYDIILSEQEKFLSVYGYLGT
jgi:hypothetical protein